MHLAKKFAAAAMLGLAIGAHAQDRTRGEACLAPGAWYALADDATRAVQAHDLMQQMAAREVVLLGERHDETSHHQWQLQTLAALHLLRPDMVIGFESFPRRVQPALDRWTAGELTVEQFLAQTEWTKVWNFAPELYLPLFHFARLNRIPMVALNVERSLTQAVRTKGWDAVPAEQKEGVSRPAPPSDSYREVLYEAFARHARNSKGKSAAADRDSAAFHFFVEAQQTWDRAMAEALAARAAAAGNPRPLVVGIMGSGHVRGRHGVPHQLRALGVRSVGVLLPVDASGDCSEFNPDIADAVFAVPQLPNKVAPQP